MKDYYVQIRHRITGRPVRSGLPLSREEAERFAASVREMGIEGVEVVDGDEEYREQDEAREEGERTEVAANVTISVAREAAYGEL